MSWSDSLSRLAMTESIFWFENSLLSSLHRSAGLYPGSEFIGGGLFAILRLRSARGMFARTWYVYVLVYRFAERRIWIF